MTTTPKSRPIPFSGPMMLAVLRGKKDWTRRLVKSQPPGHVTHASFLVRSANHPQRPHWQAHWMAGPEEIEAAEFVGDWTPCPYGDLDDRLWCQEAHRLREGDGAVVVEYTCDGVERSFPLDDMPPHVAERMRSYRNWGTLRPSRFLFRHFARETLEIKALDLQRVLEVSDEDAVGEGFQTRQGFLNTFYGLNKRAPRGSNPWVWAVGFRRVEP